MVASHGACFQRLNLPRYLWANIMLKNAKVLMFLPVYDLIPIHVSFLQFLSIIYCILVSKKNFNINFCGPLLAFFNLSPPIDSRSFVNFDIVHSIFVLIEKNHNLLWLISFLYSGNCCTRSSRQVFPITTCFCGLMLTQLVPVAALI